MQTDSQPLSVSWADTVLSEPQPAPRPAPALEPMRLSADELIGLELEPGTRDVAERMLEHGCSPEFVRLVLGEVLRAEARGTHAIDAAASVLARALPILPSPKRPRGSAKVPLFAFVGPTGVGKTTALVKLGRKLREAGRRVLFASLDPLSLETLARVGGLESDIDRGEIPLASVRSADDLRKLLRQSGAVDTVLLDTPGLSPRDDEHLDELARELARCVEPCAATTLLVLSAAAGRGALRLTTQAFAPFRAGGGVLTKLDETDEPGTALEALVRTRLPVAFLCDGQDARAHLLRPTAEALGDLVLRGHLAGSNG